MKLIACTNELQRAEKLKNSCILFGWDFTIYPVEWKGFGTKLHTVYNHFANHPEDTELIFVDAHDSVVTDTPQKVQQRIHDMNTGKEMILSAEIACWPDVHRAKDYPETGSLWNHVNGGGYYVTRKQFMKLFESDRPAYDGDDQRWLTNQYLNNTDEIYLDVQCKLFQTMAHTRPEHLNTKDFINNVTSQVPLIWHGNGTADMTQIYKTLSI